MWHILGVTLVILVVGCSRSVEPNATPTIPAPPAIPAPPPAALGHLSEPEQKAVIAARQLLERQKVSWGDPESIKLILEGKQYWITYPTPDREQKVLGPRVVTVEVATWEAKQVMRD